MDLLDWQRIDSLAAQQDGAAERRVSNVETFRAKVPGGWLVAIFKWDREMRGPRGVEPQIDFENSTGLTFVPDVNHSWNQKIA
jgi:hypothetical protein